MNESKSNENNTNQVAEGVVEGDCMTPNPLQTDNNVECPFYCYANFSHNFSSRSS